MHYFCIVCFYNAELTGKFTVDYIFTNMSKAQATLEDYIIAIENSEKEDPTQARRCWPELYIAQITPLVDEEYYVYLDQTKKRLYISLYQIENSPFLSRKLLLPDVSDIIPDEFIL